MALLGFTLPPDSGEKLTLGRVDNNYKNLLFFFFWNRSNWISAPKSSFIYKISSFCFSIRKIQMYQKRIQETTKIKGMFITWSNCRGGCRDPLKIIFRRNRPAQSDNVPEPGFWKTSTFETACIFWQKVGDSMPKTSEAVPLISKSSSSGRSAPLN